MIGMTAWFILQSSIIFAVIASNLFWHWTPNGYLAGLVGVGLAWVLTRLLSARWRRGNDI
jgi:hypothetical protein